MFKNIYLIFFNPIYFSKFQALNTSSFELFIDTYKLKEDELQKVYKYLPTNTLRNNEYALKLSNSIVVPKVGIGRIVLTQKWLFTY